MLLNKTAVVLASLCLSVATAISAQSSDGTKASASAGQRIQLDKDGNLLQHTVRDAHDHSVGHGTTDSFTTGSAIRGISAPPAAPAVIRTGPATGVVVRLNGQFRAASRAQIGPDGKLQGDCHINSNAKADKGDKK